MTLYFRPGSIVYLSNYILEKRGWIHIECMQITVLPCKAERLGKSLGF